MVKDGYIRAQLGVGDFLADKSGWTGFGEIFMDNIAALVLLLNCGTLRTNRMPECTAESNRSCTGKWIAEQDFGSVQVLVLKMWIHERFRCV